jgi:DNA mismatch repair ATPase MutL
LIAESFSLTPKEFEIVENYKEIFLEMWFEIELMWNNIVLINAVPDLIKKENLRKIFLWVIEDIWELWIKKSKTLEEVRNKILAYTACRSAVKFWDKLNLFEMNKLLNDASLDYSATCPHWRPVIFEIWLDDLKNKYER